MKILHVSTATSWRGGEQQIAYLVGELQAKKIAQLVCCPARSPLHRFCLENNIGVASFERRGLLDLALAGVLRRICRKENISLVHAHDSHAHSAAVLASAVYRNTVPLVVSRRVDFRISPHFFSRWKYNYPGIGRIICVSQKIREVMAADVRDTDRLCVIYDGIDLAQFSPAQKKSLLHDELGLASHLKLAGNASALADHKDYFTFIDTAEIVLKKFPGTRFVIIGEGPEKISLEKYIAGKQLETKIFLTGFRENVKELLPELDIFLMTSVTEGLGSIVLDAFAAGVPVVATDAGGIPEIVKNGNTGLTAPVKNAELLAAHVCRLLGDADLYRAIQNNALQFVRNFSKEHMALETLNIYKDLLKANSGSLA